MIISQIKFDEGEKSEINKMIIICMKVCRWGSELKRLFWKRWKQGTRIM